jgi:branched-chain amino acid transport system ATP-binding protein
MSAQPVLSVHGITKSFGGLKALMDVSFDIHEGDVFGIIGPNGSGKTTLINCITVSSRRRRAR